MNAAERLALIERPLGGVADEGRGHDIAFAEPEGDDIRPPKPQKRHLTDAVTLKS